MRLRVVHAHDLDEQAVERAVAFVLGQPQVQPLHGLVAVKVATSGDGYAAKRVAGREWPRWAGRARWCIRAGTGGGKEEALLLSPRFRVCGHHRGRRYTQEELAVIYCFGDRRAGRWPVYVVADRWEFFVNLLAHEAMHVVQFQNGRVMSEVECEVFAAAVLELWRRERDFVLP